jgi:hypothetical protein
MDEIVSVHAAKTHLSQLLARVEAGEVITIARGADSGGQSGPDRPEGQTGIRCNARKNRRWPGIFRAIISNTCFTEQSWLDSTPPLSGLAVVPLECQLKGVVAGARTGFENSTGRSWGTGSARDVPEPVLGGMLRVFPLISATARPR